VCADDVWACVCGVCVCVRGCAHTHYTRTQRCTSIRACVCARAHIHGAAEPRARALTQRCSGIVACAQGVHTYKRMQMLTYNKTEMLT
jgi:hypothetical protein